MSIRGFGLWLSAGLLAGCPTVKAVTWNVDPATHEAVLRLHDVRTDDGTGNDWLMAGAMIRSVEREGPGVVGSNGIVRYERVGDALDVVLQLTLDDAAIDALLPRSVNTRLLCAETAILATNGHDLTDTIDAPCVVFGREAPEYSWTVAGDADDDDESLLGAWLSAGAPATVAVEPFTLD